MKSSHLIVVSLALVFIGCAHDPGAKRIDATSIEAILASLEGQPKEDATLIKTLVCHSADEFNSQSAELQARTLETPAPAPRQNGEGGCGGNHP